MNKALLLIAALSIAACAATDEEKSPDAIIDFIEVNDLEEVSVIRSYKGFGQSVLNDRYVIVTTRKEQYLLAYAYRCSEFNEATREPDVRSEPHAIHAKSETFRGCRIKALYPISKGQQQELEEIGQAPGQR